MLAKFLENDKTAQIFLNYETSIEQIVKSECYMALEKIQAVVRNDSLSDPECFTRVEEIICALEDIGGNCGSRHDW